MQELEILKSCPFCNCHDGTIKNIEKYLSVINVSPPNLPQAFAVYCDNCGATGTPITLNWKPGCVYEDVIKSAKKDAIAYWNERKGCQCKK